ncbi:DNA translocase FtsK 4TM domain-containing protein [Salipiger sp. 1_MG-2023]|uniref:DNA translocase FtsK n=1 Tax=Salipiger sp. 1_MG-2023 TaxID=3062665 RepID=UPI0026E359F1|nr:DNA translocase FtsK [Salipiger sp. 1_MG-2023]MDO6585374.1 DNA translocase FtsK 4TM domain-containing protein [Salipiger sp. 1_MG-2023]
MQAAIERRGKELAGLGLVILGLMAAATIGSYTPEDPSWLSATDAPVQNWMGRIGASIAAPLFMIVGQGAWGLALVLLVWGVRLALHAGEDRAFSRIVFAPIWIALSAVYAAGQTVGPEWTHSFGLGGLFGDMMMGTILGVLPIGAGLGLKLVMIVLAVGLLALGAFVLGFTREELKAIARFLLLGMVMAYASVLQLLGRGAGASLAAARQLQAAQADRRDRRRAEEAEAAAWAAAQEAIPAPPRAVPAAAAAQTRVHRVAAEPVGVGHPEAAPRRPVPQAAPQPVPQPMSAQAPAPQPTLVAPRRAAPAPQPELDEPPVIDAQDPAPWQDLPEPKKPGLLARVIKHIEPSPEPDPQDDFDTEAWGEEEFDMGDERIRSKIADVIRNRRNGPRPAPSFVADPSKPLTKGRGVRPAPLIIQTGPKLRREPPITAAHTPPTLPPEPPVTAPKRSAAMMAAPATVRAAVPRAPAAIPPAPDLPAARAVPPAPRAEPEAFRPLPETELPEDDFADVYDEPWVQEPPVAAAPAAPVARPRARQRPADDLGYDEFTPTEHVPARYTAARAAQDEYDDLRDFDDYGEDDAETGEDGSGVNIFRENDDDTPRAWDDTDEDDASFNPEDYAPPPILRGGVEPSERMTTPVAEPKKLVQPDIRKPIQPSRRAQAESQSALGPQDQDSGYELPPLSLLGSPDAIERHHLSDEALEENARMLETVLDDYGVKGEIVSVRPGPVVTMYELEPAPGLKASRVIGLSDDIARSMSALSARVSTVPGRSVIGIELPNENREMVSFREILSSRDYGDGNQKLPLALGKDIGGDAMVANLAKMPHLLIAGTTGSGKSVAINTMILSLLYKLTPDDLRLVMIDPKMLELSVYDGIPHLLSPVVTDPKKAVVALKWVVGEMEDRYRKMSKMGVRNIDGYNGRVAEALKKGEMFSRTVQTGFDDDTGEPVFETEEIEPKKMPYIVVIVDEMADLMMVAGKEIEACIQRLAQMARASGIHLIMATQRPSVDVITGTIKANFPTRISFQVTSKIDSRTILGEMGAEQLLGMGDMLYMAGGAKITRCHGPFVSDEEVEEVVNHLKAFGPPEYVGGVVQGPDDEKADNIDAVLGLNTGGNTGGEDALYDQAVAIVIKDRKCSTSYIQRKLGIGYNKAARLVEQMEDEQVVSPANHVGKREILVPEQA